jgi:hypothetical protein
MLFSCLDIAFGGMMAIDDEIPPLPPDDDLESRLFGFDVETPKFAPGWMAPPIVLGSYLDSERGAVVLDARDAVIALREAHERKLVQVGVNTAYDNACAAHADPTMLPVIVKALRDGRVHDDSIAQGLDAIYHGYLGKMPDGSDLKKPDGKVTNRYSLYQVVGINLGRWDAKDKDEFRTSYALFQGVPLHRLPQRAREYPLDDVNNPVAVAKVQLGFGTWRKHEWDESGRCTYCKIFIGMNEPPPCVERSRPAYSNLGNLAAQVESDFWLKLGAYWGLRTDPERVAVLARDAEAKHAAAVERFQKFGWIRRDGTEDQAAVKRAVAEAYGAQVPCLRCEGTGKVERYETVACRGHRPTGRGRYPGCPGDGCQACSGSGFVRRLKSVVTCKNDEEGDGCDGSGFDLSQAPPVLRRTDTGGISTDRDAKMESGNDDLADYGNDEWQKTLTTYLPYLQTGIDRPLDYSPNALVESGRPSYEGSVLLQMPRQGKERECVRARGAWCGSPVEYFFGSSDFQAGELCCLAVYCYYLFGYSKMMDAINASGKPGILHADLAAQVIGITLPEFLKRLEAKDKQAKDFRQASKPYHFGKPAGMGAPKIVLTNRKKNVGFTECERGPIVEGKKRGYHGIRFCVLIGGAKECGTIKITEWKKRECAPVCLECCKIVENVLGPAYDRAYPEIKDFHKWVTKKTDRGDPAPSLVWSPEKDAPIITRERGGCGFSDFANNCFQSMLADIGKDSHSAVSRECYTGMTDDGAPSPLAGSRIPLFLYDECFSELIADRAHISGPRIAEIMMASGKRLAPAVTWKVDTALSRFWYKSAEAIYDDSGKLIPWEPSA